MLVLKTWYRQVNKLTMYGIIIKFIPVITDSHVCLCLEDSLIIVQHLVEVQIQLIIKICMLTHYSFMKTSSATKPLLSFGNHWMRDLVLSSLMLKMLTSLDCVIISIIKWNNHTKLWPIKTPYEDKLTQHRFLYLNQELYLSRREDKWEGNRNWNSFLRIKEWSIAVKILIAY